jgi:uncharacterized protein YbjT (DUF2867 family)
LRILAFIDGECVRLGASIAFTGFYEARHPIHLGALNVILVTSANGHIGKEVVNVLCSRGMKARAFVRKGEREREDQSGGLEYFEGDFFDRESLRGAFVGVDRVMHISPPHIPGEFAIGQTMIEFSGEHHVRHFALLSAIHPFIDALPAHRMKLLVQQYLIDSGLPFTILQPTVLMQNTQLGEVLKSGIFSVPYSIDRPISLVDRRDDAEAAAIVLSDDKHLRATCELVGTEPITARELAGLISQGSGRSILAKQISADAIIDRLPRTSVIDAFTSDAFDRMFVYYNRHGLTGNSNVLGRLLGRKSTDFPEYLRRANAEKH